jgi:hypothetical protein
MEKIYELLALIPEELGWTMVGALGMLCVVLLFSIIKMIIDGQKEEEEEI